MEVGRFDKNLRKGPAKPKNGGQFAPGMVKNFKKLPKEMRKIAESGFSKFSHEAMSQLNEAGVSVRFVKAELGEGAGGRYIDRGEIIELYVKPDDPHTESYLIHELVHAMDRIKLRQESSPGRRLLTTTLQDSFSSRNDPKLRELHLDYAKRTLPSVGQEMAQYLRENPQVKGKPLQAGARSYDWNLEENKLTLKERDKATRYMEAVHPSLNMGVLGAVGAFAAVAVGVAASAPLIGGLVALPLVALGAKNLASAFRSIKDERALVGHKSDGVEVSENQTVFHLDQELSSEQKNTTVYATLNRRPEEYLAESMTEYLRSDESRDSLQERDPEMFEYCKSWNIASF